MEGSFSTLKTERVRHKVDATRQQARADLFDYVERFYNTKTPHTQPRTVSGKTGKAQVRWSPGG